MPKIVTKKTYVLYDWYEDIQDEICKILGIDNDRFHDYYDSGSHFYKWCDSKGYGETDPDGKNRGASNIWYKEYMEDPDGNAKRPPYCNFWHVALETVVPDGMHNDSVVTMWKLEDYPEDKDYYLEKHGEKAVLFLDAYNAVLEKLDPDNKGIEVEFSW